MSCLYSIEGVWLELLSADEHVVAQVGKVHVGILQTILRQVPECFPLIEHISTAVGNIGPIVAVSGRSLGSYAGEGSLVGQQLLVIVLATTTLILIGVHRACVVGTTEIPVGHIDGGVAVEFDIFHLVSMLVEMVLESFLTRWFLTDPHEAEEAGS